MCKPIKKLEWKTESTKRSFGHYVKYEIGCNNEGLYFVILQDVSGGYKGLIATNIKTIEDAKRIAQDNYSKWYEKTKRGNK